MIIRDVTLKNVRNHQGPETCVDEGERYEMGVLLFSGVVHCLDKGVAHNFG